MFLRFVTRERDEGDEGGVERKEERDEGLYHVLPLVILAIGEVLIDSLMNLTVTGASRRLE